MFRKIIHIVLSLFLVVITTGITFSMHYCGSKLISVSVNNETKSCCDSHCGNCNNKTLRVEVEDQFLIPDQIESSNSIEQNLLFPVLIANNDEILSRESKTLDLFSDSSPPSGIPARLSLLQTYLC